MQDTPNIKKFLLSNAKLYKRPKLKLTFVPLLDEIPN